MNDQWVGMGRGRRRHGKAQLRIDDARRWMARAIEHAEGGEAGGLAALMALLMGLRCSEIVSRVVRATWVQRREAPGDR